MTIPLEINYEGTMTDTIPVADIRPDSTHVARPLHVLLPLIRDDLQQGREAAERAAMPYYQAAGEKLLEAKTQCPHGQFRPWIERNFKIKYRQATYYMRLAEEAARQKCSALPFSSLS